jgi:hypothetical protein
MILCPNWLRGILFLLLGALLSSCFPSKKLTVAATASLLEDVAKSAYRQSDLRLIREGMPAYLLLLDGMVQGWPDNEQLLLGAAQGYSAFASSLVSEQDKEYAKLLYGRSKDYALKALELRGLKAPPLCALDDFTDCLRGLGKEDVPYMFWAATSWGSWISLNLDSVEALAELPRVELLMRRVLELDETFHHGGPHLFMGVWYASRPKMAGGDLDKARSHFLRSLELGEGKFLMTYVYYADHYARRAQDRELFISILRKVLETPADALPDLTLLNTVARTKAEDLLKQVDEIFE